MTARSTFALPRIFGGTPANDTPPAPVSQEPSLDDLEHALALALQRLGDAEAHAERCRADVAEAEAAFVARAGRLLYHHTIVAAEGEIDGEASTGVSQTPPSD